jgi:hypothetical protein
MTKTGQRYFRANKVRMRHRKKSVGDMYILPRSVHSKKLNQGILKGEFLRFVTLCSTEKEYEKPCDRYSKVTDERI